MLVWEKDRKQVNKEERDGVDLQFMQIKGLSGLRKWLWIPIV